jgi:hypothetical protein
MGRQLNYRSLGKDTKASQKWAAQPRHVCRTIANTIVMRHQQTPAYNKKKSIRKAQSKPRIDLCLRGFVVYF